MITRFILPVIASFFLGSCSEEKKEGRMDASDLRDGRVVELEEEVSDLKAGNERERVRFHIQSEANTALIGQLKELLTELRQRPGTAQRVNVESVVTADPKNELEERKRVLDSIRMARLVAVGEEHDLLVTGRGEPFHQVVITEVTDIGISIRHRGGAGRITFEDLPKSWQERFGYDPARAVNALRREHLFRTRYEIWANKELLAQKEKNEELNRELRAARLALEEARAGAPVITVVDQNPNLIPVRQTILHSDHHDAHDLSRPIPLVPGFGGSGSSPYCPPGSQTFPQPSKLRPVQRPVPTHAEAVTRPPITRPPAGSSSSPARHPVSVRSPEVSRPSRR